jgi:DNA-binding transcriptional MerR regulator
MFKISDFARLSQVSMRTLRYYDVIGLLKPIRVDRDSGYRYYSIDQLPRLNRILALKDLGFELVQVVQLMDEDLPAAEMRGMLRLKQMELQQRLQVEQERLARVEARLNHIEMEGRPLKQDVLVKKVKPQIVALSRKVATNFAHKAQFSQELLDFLKQNGVKQVDYPLYIYQGGGHYDNDMNVVEVAVPVDSSSVGNIVERSTGRVTVRELPGVNSMATILYPGSPYTLVEAYQELGKWMQINDYSIIGPCRDVCLRHEGNLHDYLTEIQFPVEKKEI